MRLNYLINNIFEWKLIVLFCLIISISLVFSNLSIGGSSKLATPPQSHRPSEIFMPDDGCVPDNETAIRIAEAIWIPIYGDEIYERKPFIAELIGDSVWAVAGRKATSASPSNTSAETVRLD